MKLRTTFRGLDRSESASATTHLQRNVSRLERLLERPARFRAVIEGDGAARKVNLWLAAGRGEFNSRCINHDMPTAIAMACERIRCQLIRRRGKKASGRQKPAA